VWTDSQTNKKRNSWEQLGTKVYTNKQKMAILPITLVPLYLGGTIPEKVGTKQEARMTWSKYKMLCGKLMSPYLNELFPCVKLADNNILHIAHLCERNTEPTNHLNVIFIFKLSYIALNHLKMSIFWKNYLKSLT
jgi:hypothetical protein